MSDDRIHITANIPPGSFPDEKKTIRAGAFQKGLSLASSAPNFRLRMILGEAWQKHCDLIRWIADELEKDEEKAPGLWRLAWDMSGDPEEWIRQGTRVQLSQTLVETQGRLLQEAVAETITRRNLIQKAAAGEDDADAVG